MSVCDASKCVLFKNFGMIHTLALHVRLNKRIWVCSITLYTHLKHHPNSVFLRFSFYVRHFYCSHLIYCIHFDDFFFISSLKIISINLHGCDTCHHIILVKIMFSWSFIWNVCRSVIDAIWGNINYIVNIC